MADKRSSIFGFFDRDAKSGAAVMDPPMSLSNGLVHEGRGIISRYQMESMMLGSWRPQSAPAQQMFPVPDKPSTDMLTRLAAPEPLTGDSRTALAVEVEDRLGYTPLRADVGAPSKLRRLLAELEIEPFDPKTVDTYRHKMQAHFQSKADAQMMEGMERERQRYGDGIFFSGFSAVVSWDMVPLRSYSKPVPEFVLRKALAIQKHAAAAGETAQFFVHELRERQVTLDPFLVVTLGSDVERETAGGVLNIDHAYIEVWDEPEFETARCLTPRGRTSRGTYACPHRRATVAPWPLSSR